MLMKWPVITFSRVTVLPSLVLLSSFIVGEVGESFKCAERNLTVMCLLVSIIFVNVFLRG